MVDQGAVLIVARLDPEAMEPAGRQLIGIVRIEVVQEREERPPRLRARAEPVEQLAIDLRRPLAIGCQRPARAAPGGEASRRTPANPP